MMRKGLVIVLSGICLICIVLLLVPVNKKEIEIEQPRDVAVKKEKVEDVAVNVMEQYRIQYNNSDIVALLDIPNTNINTVVPRGEDNEFYLNHLPDKQENSLGSVFLDYRNELDDRKLIIYGHNSPNVDTLFKGLEQYLNSDYYSTHNNIYLQTDYTRYRYQIFSVYIATSNVSHVNLNLTNKEYKRHLQWLKEESIYDTGVSIYDEDILILQTCFYNPENSYLIIAAKKVED